MTFLNRLSVGSAFVSCASRMVGASYRVWDAYDPKLRQQGVTPAPELVIKREGISLGLAWIFGLFTSLLADGMEKRFKIPGKVGLFINVVIANILAEGVSRLIAYRNAPGHSQVSAPSPLALVGRLPQLMPMRMASLERSSAQCFYPPKNKAAETKVYCGFL